MDARVGGIVHDKFFTLFDWRHNLMEAVKRCVARMHYKNDGLAVESYSLCFKEKGF